MEHSGAESLYTPQSMEVPDTERPENKDIFIQDPLLGHDPTFERRQHEYVWIARSLSAAFEKGENIHLGDEQQEILERVFIAMSVIDSLIDDQKKEKQEVVKQIVGKSSASEGLNRAMSELERLIEKHGDYPAYIADVARAISYSGKESMQDRHRESLYLGKAIAEAIERDGPRQKHLVKVLGVLASFANFSDDVVDYKEDGKSGAWARKRAFATLREAKDLYRVSNNPNEYIRRIISQAFTYYGRQMVHKLLRKGGDT